MTVGELKERLEALDDDFVVLTNEYAGISMVAASGMNVFPEDRVVEIY